MDLDQIAAIDQHAHNLLEPEAFTESSFIAAFTESDDPSILERHVRQTALFRRSMRDIAGLLGCEPTEEAVLEERSRLGLEELTARCFAASRLSAVFIDDGFMAEKTLPWTWHSRFVEARRILRLEYLAECLIPAVPGFDEFLDSFLAHLHSLPPEVVALKSIAAYRTGLVIGRASRKEAREGFEEAKKEARQGRFRLSQKPLIDFLVCLGMDTAAAKGLPVQFHTGFGDPDLDLRLANPLHLRSVLEERRWRDVPVVLLHAGYPYVRETAYLASIYGSVFADVGLAIPFLSMEGMRGVFRQLMELAPWTKVMFSSDAHAVPELFYLGAKRGREALGGVLEQAVHDSDLSVEEAWRAAESILAENARRVYLLGR